MQIPLVLTVIGRDRTGLVESLAGAVAQHEGNWLESRMCRLGGQFAGILRLRVPREREAALRAALAALEAQGLSLVVLADQETADHEERRAQLELVGQDRPGIVLEITRVLAATGVNVEELTTECVSAPMSGEPLFRAETHLRLPPNCDVTALRGALEKIAADLMVDFKLAEVPAGERDARDTN